MSRRSSIVIALVFLAGCSQATLPYRPEEQPKGANAYIDAAWLGTNGAALASRALGRPVLFLNDADAAGLAETRFGSGRGCTGTVIMVTFGTGIGSALFTGGRLFPNSELGHLELHGMDAEKW